MFLFSPPYRDEPPIYPSHPLHRKGFPLPRHQSRSQRVHTSASQFSLSLYPLTPLLPSSFLLNLFRYWINYYRLPKVLCTRVISTNSNANPPTSVPLPNPTSPPPPPYVPNPYPSTPTIPGPSIIKPLTTVTPSPNPTTPTTPGPNPANFGPNPTSGGSSNP